MTRNGKLLNGAMRIQNCVFFYVCTRKARHTKTMCLKQAFWGHLNDRCTLVCHGEFASYFHEKRRRVPATYRSTNYSRVKTRMNAYFMRWYLSYGKRKIPCLLYGYYRNFNQTGMTTAQWAWLNDSRSIKFNVSTISLREQPTGHLKATATNTTHSQQKTAFVRINSLFKP